jgi:hypothetical protein
VSQKKKVLKKSLKTLKNVVLDVGRVKLAVYGIRFFAEKVRRKVPDGTWHFVI